MGATTKPAAKRQQPKAIMMHATINCFSFIVVVSQLRSRLVTFSKQQRQALCPPLLLKSSVQSPAVHCLPQRALRILIHLCEDVATQGRVLVLLRERIFVRCKLLQTVHDGLGLGLCRCKALLVGLLCLAERTSVRVVAVVHIVATRVVAVSEDR